MPKRSVVDLSLSQDTARARSLFEKLDSGARGDIFGARFHGSAARDLSRTPFLRLLTDATSSEIPKSFDECVDFFFPTSGVFSYPRGGQYAPFQGSYTGAYTVSDEMKTPYSRIATPFNVGGGSGGVMPKHLGDVSMMLGYFILYRTLLAPSTFIQAPLPGEKNASVFFKDPNTPERSINEPRVAELRKHYGRVTKTLRLSKRILNTALNLASAAVQSGGLDSLNSMSASEIMDTISENEDVRDFIHYGADRIVRHVLDELGVPPKYAPAVVRYAIQGVISPPDYAALSTNAKAQLESFVTAELVDLGVPNSDITKLYGRYSIGTVPDAVYRTLSSKGKAAVAAKRKEIEDAFRPKVTSFTNKERTLAALGVRQNPRENPEPITMGILVGTLLAASAKGSDALHNAEISNLRKDQRRAENYFHSSKWTLNPQLAPDLTAKLAFDDFANTGLPKGDVLARIRQLKHYEINRWPDTTALKDGFGWHNRYQIPATCRLVNGGLLRAFWDRTWQNFVEPIHLLRSGETLDRVLKRSTAEADHVFPCPMFTIFEENSFKSLTTMLENLYLISPFTLDFGFKPTYSDSQSPEWAKFRGVGASGSFWLDGSPNLNIKYGQLVNYDMRPDKKFQVLALPGSPVTYYLRQAGEIRAHRIRGLSTDKSKAINAVGFDEVNSAGLDNLPHNSRRVLSGEIPQLDIHFDVGLNDVPIFDAQWAALLSVLILYPEALDTAERAGYSWAPVLKQSLEAKRRETAAKEAMDNAQLQAARALMDSGRIFDPQDPTQFVRRQFENVNFNLGLESALQLQRDVQSGKTKLSEPDSASSEVQATPAQTEMGTAQTAVGVVLATSALAALGLTVYKIHKAGK